MTYTNLRLLYLLDIFRQETDEAHRLTVPQLVDALAERDIAAERKSIYRDIQALIKYGVDIHKSAAGYYLKGRAFLPGEVRILAEALRAAPFLTRRRTEDLTNRLGLFLSRHQAQSALAPGLGAPKAPNDEALRSLEALQAAIAGCCQITFSYREGESQGGFPANRLRASPYAIIMAEGRCCLVCTLEGREGLSLLPLSRIAAVRRDATPWRHFARAGPYAVAFDAWDYAARQARLCAGEHAPLLLACREEALPAALARLEPCQPPHRQADGRFLLAAEASLGPGLTAWLLSFGDDLEVLEPHGLRQAMRQSLQAALAMYESEPEPQE